MPGMIERVAWAIALCLGDEHNVTPKDIEMARAAIAAMRDISDELLVKAGFPDEVDDWYGSQMLMAGGCWKDIINAALSE